ncbi:MAG: transcriptional repressor LexA [Eubacteriales bacterium]|nr:transcriptional repressor LexA [Eubacteriales bacterium]MDD4324265.1 transcriptional repressor LexA [Eubacteriales bacterium]MDD4540907.1 transcriptional repressor LexA [Eubacteriales bacterium]
MKDTYQFTKANVDETCDTVYDYIVDYISDNGYAPSVREIGRGVGLKSTSTVYGHLKRLVDQNRIEMTKGKRRAISLVDEGNPMEVDYDEVPLLGTVTAGMPILATENIESMLKLPQDTYASTENMFALRVRGDSMVGAAILDGDLVLVRKQNTADSGEVVLALLGDEATVKTLIRDDQGHCLLRAENAAYADIPFESEDCKILGVVCGLLRFRV